MAFSKVGHMSKYKKGKLKDREQYVYCKLLSRELGNCPEIHISTDGSSSKPDEILKVKSFAAVKETDQVPKVVKAKFDNYIYVRGEKGVETYLRTENRQQRDEWCAILQSYFDLGAAASQDAVHRERGKSDATPNKPPQSRNRRQEGIVSGPGTAVGLFHELSMKLQTRDSTPPKPGDGTGRTDTVQIYENTNNMDPLKDEQSRRALQQSRDLYSDLHHLNAMQMQIKQEDEELYEVPIDMNVYEVPLIMNSRHHDRIPEENLWSGWSTSSAEIDISVPGTLRSTDSSRQPCESAWPPSPELVSNELSPEYAQKTSSTRTTLKPEAKLCQPTKQSESNEEIYVNREMMYPKPPRRTTSGEPIIPNPLRQHQRRGKQQHCSRTVEPIKPPLPTRAESLPSSKYSVLAEEKMRRFVEVSIDKRILIRHLPQLAQVHDRILVTHVPAKLRDYFRVGDQWLKVNDQMLNSVDFAKSCIEMSDKKEMIVILTVKRIPYGSVCAFHWTSSDRADVGLQLNGPEISEWKDGGIAMTHSNLQAIDTTSLTTAGVRCNYAITEVNFEPVLPHSSTETVWKMIEKARPHVDLVLHPVDFFSRAWHSSCKFC